MQPMPFNETCRLKLGRIDVENRHYQISTPADLGRLRDSIASIGLINPLTVHALETGRWAVVCGFRRLAVCRDMGWAEAPVRFLADDVDAVRRAEMAIADNISVRSLNLVEQARALALLAQACRQSADISTIARRLGLPAAENARKKMRAVLTLPTPVQTLIADGAISLAMAIELTRFDCESAAQMAELFGLLHLNLNRQRELLTLIVEIAARDKLDAIDVIQDQTIQTIVHHSQMPTPEKSRQVRQLLTHRRYPTISDFQQKFVDRRQSLHLPAGVQLLPPANFEGQAYALRIDFSNSDQLGSQLKAIAHLHQHPALTQILSAR